MIYSVILSNSENKGLYTMTKNAVDGYLSTTEGYLCLVETNKDAMWENNERFTVIYPNITFNYNAFLNIGFNAAKIEYPYYGIFNNDVVFGIDWMKKALGYEWDSFSPCSDGWHKHDSQPNGISYGWETGKYMCGWAVVMKKAAFDSVYPFDERFEFWCQDDDMALTLKNNGFKHAFIKESKVKHLESKSHGLLNNRERMTSGMIKILKQKWG